MATYNPKTGQVELSNEDREILQSKHNLDVKKLQNWIIWGNPQGQYEKSTNN